MKCDCPCLFHPFPRHDATGYIVCSGTLYGPCSLGRSLLYFSLLVCVCVCVCCDANCSGKNLVSKSPDEVETWQESVNGSSSQTERSGRSKQRQIQTGTGNAPQTGSAAGTTSRDQQQQRCACAQRQRLSSGGDRKWKDGGPGWLVRASAHVRDRVFCAGGARGQDGHGRTACGIRRRPQDESDSVRRFISELTWIMCVYIAFLMTSDVGYSLFVYRTSGSIQSGHWRIKVGTIRPSSLQSRAVDSSLRPHSSKQHVNKMKIFKKN